MSEIKPDRKYGVCFLLTEDSESNFARDRLVLGCSRKDDYNAWGLPGGSVEPGESFREAIIREVYEETSLRIREETLTDFFMYETATETCICFVGETDGVLASQTGEGKTKFVSWPDLIKGPFGTFNALLYHKLVKSNFFENASVASYKAP